MENGENEGRGADLGCSPCAVRVVYVSFETALLDLPAWDGKVISSQRSLWWDREKHSIPITWSHPPGDMIGQ